MRITVNAAAKAGYASRPTIYRHIEQGKLSVHMNDKGAKAVDSADLTALYGEPTAQAIKPPPTSTGNHGARIAELEAELTRTRLKTDELEQKLETVREKAESERDRLLRIVENSQLAIPDMRQNTVSGGFWKRLFG